MFDLLSKKAACSLVLFVFFLSSCVPTISSFNSPVQPITSPAWFEYAPYSAKEITTLTISSDFPDQAQINQISKIVCDTVVTQQGGDLLKKYTCEQFNNHRFENYSMTTKMSVLGELADVSLFGETLDGEEIDNLTGTLIKGLSPVINNPITSGSSIFKTDMSNFLDILDIEGSGDMIVDEVVRGWSRYNGKKVLVVDSTDNVTIKVPNLFNCDLAILGYKLIDPATMAVLKSEGSIKGQFLIDGKTKRSIGILFSTHLDSYSPARTSSPPAKTTGQNHQKTYDEAVSAYNAEDYGQAFDKWLPLAAKSHPESAFRLADMYDFALGVEQDYQQAAMWYLAAAQRGHGEAQCKIANRYSIGQGIQSSKKESYKWSWLCSRNKDATSNSKYHADIYMRSAHSVGMLSSEEIQQIELQAKMWTPKPALSLSTVRQSPNHETEIPTLTPVRKNIKVDSAYKYIGETVKTSTVSNGRQVKESIRTYKDPGDDKKISSGVQIFTRELKTGYWQEGVFTNFPHVIYKNKINVDETDYQQVVFIGEISNKKFFRDKGYLIPEELIIWGISEDLGIHDEKQVNIFYAEDLTVFYGDVHRNYNDIFPRETWLNPEIHSQKQKKSIEDFISRAKQSISLFSEEGR